MDGWDSVLSILQMPNGVPVATVALNAAQNAGLIAAQILGTSDRLISKKIERFKINLKKKIENSAKLIDKKGWNSIDL